MPAQDLTPHQSLVLLELGKILATIVLINDNLSRAIHLTSDGGKLTEEQKKALGGAKKWIDALAERSEMEQDDSGAMNEEDAAESPGS